MYQTKISGVESINASIVRPEAYSYDYITVETAEKFAIEYVDCYEAFGWQYVKRETTFNMKTILTFKRSRKITNKLAINKLQVKLDEALRQLNSHEQSKTTAAFTTAICIGSVGALTLGGGMSMCILGSGLSMMIGGIALGVVGLALCGLGYLGYIKIHKKKSAAISILMDKQREEIGALCEQANKLLKV